MAATAVKARLQIPLEDRPAPISTRQKRLQALRRQEQADIERLRAKCRRIVFRHTGRRLEWPADSSV